MTSFDKKHKHHHHHNRHEDDDRSWVTMENEGGARESAEGYSLPKPLGETATSKDLSGSLATRTKDGTTEKDRIISDPKGKHHHHTKKHKGSKVRINSSHVDLESLSLDKKALDESIKELVTVNTELKKENEMLSTQVKMLVQAYRVLEMGQSRLAKTNQTLVDQKELLLQELNHQRSISFQLMQQIDCLRAKTDESAAQNTNGSDNASQGEQSHETDQSKHAWRA